MGEEHRWQGTLCVNVRKHEKELEDLKSVLPLFATSNERDAAAKLALEIQGNGFAARSVEEVRKILRGQSPMTEATQAGETVIIKGVTRLRTGINKSIRIATSSSWIGGGSEVVDIGGIGA